MTAKPFYIQKQVFNTYAEGNSYIAYDFKCDIGEMWDVREVLPSDNPVLAAYSKESSGDSTTTTYKEISSLTPAELLQNEHVRKLKDISENMAFYMQQVLKYRNVQPDDNDYAHKNLQDALDGYNKFCKTFTGKGK